MIIILMDENTLLDNSVFILNELMQKYNLQVHNYFKIKMNCVLWDLVV